MLDSALAETDLFIEFLKRFPVLEALQDGPRDRERLGRRLDVSTATTYRRTGWLTRRGLVEESDDGFALTPLGEAIADGIVAYEEEVRAAKGDSSTTPDLLVDLIRRSPMLEALYEDPLDRQDLEHLLDISRTTSHRFTRSLDEVDLIEKSGGVFSLTPLGEAVTDAVSSFKTNARMALYLGPVLGPVLHSTPGIDIDDFSDARVTTAEYGDPYGPMTRFVSLLQETETLRGFDTFSIAPGYMNEYQQRVLDGMVTEVIDFPAISEDVMDNYPERCVQVCASKYFTLRIHDDLPFGLVILDDRVGIGVREADERTLRTFVDTGSPAVRDWAEVRYESYEAEAVRLERFTKEGLREAMEAP